MRDGRERERGCVRDGSEREREMERERICERWQRKRESKKLYGKMAERERERICEIWLKERESEREIKRPVPNVIKLFIFLIY